MTWEGGTIAPGEFDEFGLSAKVPAEPGTLTFPATQTYSNGEVVHWIGAPDADEPAPQVKLTAAAAEEETAAPAPTETTAAAETEDDESDTDTLALVFGIAGLVAGVAALVLTLVRRPRRA